MKIEKKKNTIKFGWKLFHIRLYDDAEICLDNVFCYVHFTDGFRVLYGWASVFPIIGSISLASFLTITFFRVCKLTTHSYLMLKTVSELFSAKTFGLFQSLIECIYRHLILDIGAWTNLNIKETGKLRWNRVNICSPPFSTIKLLRFKILYFQLRWNQVNIFSQLLSNQ